MRSVLDDLLVGLVLLASVGYAMYALGPKRLRAPLLLGMASLLGRLPKSMGLHAVAQRLGRAADSKSKASCGGCDNCGSEKAAITPSSTNEVGIPLSKIGGKRR